MEVRRLIYGARDINRHFIAVYYGYSFTWLVAIFKRKMYYIYLHEKYRRCFSCRRYFYSSAKDLSVLWVSHVPVSVPQRNNKITF